MKLTVSASAVLAVVGVSVAGYAAWRAGRAASGLADTAGAAARKVVAAVNPFDRENLAYQSVNWVGATVTGDDEFALGVAIYNATHDDPFEPTRNTDFVELPPYFAP